MDLFKRTVLVSFQSCRISTQKNIGLLVDIDGVVYSGSKPLQRTKEAFQLIKDKRNNKLTIPTVFLTNGYGSQKERIKQLSTDLEIEPTSFKIVLSPSVLTYYKSLHEKRTLAVGQYCHLAGELGFTDVVTIDQLNELFPEYDCVDIRNKQKILLDEGFQEKVVERSRSFRPIESILLMGEPTHWERSLQLLCDILLTNGTMKEENLQPTGSQLPIISCNLDLQYKSTAELARLGHGAFTSCLEVLFYRLTGRLLRYRLVVGKPFLPTSRLAEHCLNVLADDAGYGRLDEAFLIGDNPLVDVVAANVLKREIKKKEQVNSWPELAELKRSLKDCHGILVKTGVFRDGWHHFAVGRPSDQAASRSFSDLTYQFCSQDLLPLVVVDDFYHALRFVLDRHS